MQIDVFDNVYSAILCIFGIINSAVLCYTKAIETGGIFMISDKKKASNAKWDKENMTSLACRVKKDYAEKFKSACAEAGTTPNAVLKKAVEEFLQTHTK